MSRTGTIFRLSWPLVLVFLCQNAMIVATLAMAGRLGDAALAGVGIGNALFAVFLALLFGLDTGVQAIAARRSGAGDMAGARAALADGLTLGVAAGVLLAAVTYFVAPAALAHAVDDSAVIAAATQYAKAAAAALLFFGINIAFSAYWNGTARPKFSFLAILVQLPVSILTSYLLIFGALGLPRLEATGAGLGMTLGALAATLTHVFVSRLQPGDRHVFSAPPSWPGMAATLRIGSPVSAQQALLYVGTLIFLAIIALLGTREVASANVVGALILFSILPATGVGIAAATLVGASLGAGRADDAARWGWEAGAAGALLVAPVSLAFLVAPETVLRLFVESETTVAVAADPLRLVAAAMCIDAFGRVLGFALRGAGATRVATLVPFGFQWGLSLPLAWLVGIAWEQGLAGIFLMRLVLTALETAAICVVWWRGRWSGVRVGGVVREQAVSI
ncbi:MATE family efflux transporter [Parvibaculum sp.]|uniref:MATE family efflux transporter n=1 Tax=Parvibaculum sp. TaxID=2024848 RepID=UPI0034A0AE02